MLPASLQKYSIPYQVHFDSALLSRYGLHQDIIMFKFFGTRGQSTIHQQLEENGTKKIAKQLNCRQDIKAV